MLTFELNGSMKAILQLEQRIMAELTEVQEIQDRLANSRMVRNMEQDDFRAALFNRDDPIDNIVIKSTTSEVGRGIRKSNFQRRGSVTRDRSNRSGVIKSSTNIKVDDAFEPTYSVVSSQYEGRRQEDSSKMGRSPSKHKKPSDKHTEKGTNLKILKPRRENRRWSILDCEEIESNEVNREHIQGSKVSKGNLRLVSNSSSALNLKQNNVSHSGINKNKAQQYNKENINSNYMASPCKRGGRLNSSGLRQESTSSLLDSKKKERDYPEYSFRPQLSSKSMKIAEGLVSII
jgi:hypothetical protein